MQHHRALLKNDKLHPITRPVRILVIKLYAQFPDFPIKLIWMDNAAEFTSTTFIHYCESISINFEVSTHVHAQNGMAESLIKQIQVIVRPILLKSNLPSSTWGHAAQLLRLRS